MARVIKALQNILALSVLAQAQVQSSDVDERNAAFHPPYRPIEDQMLLFPMLEKDYFHWGSLGSAVFLSGKAVIAPEAIGKKGLIHTVEPNEKKDHWLAMIDFKIGREKTKEFNRGGEGFAIYYLRNFDAGNPDILNNFYGFTDEYDGVGIFINTANFSRPDKGSTQKRVSISSASNDG